MSKQKLLDIAEVARRHNLTVISDEIYARLTYGMEYTCFASLPGVRENTILLGGFSKAYAMTGWRVGYAVAPREIIGAMTKIHQYTIMCAPTSAQVAAIEALKTGETDVLEMVEDYNRRRKFIVKGLNEIGLTCFEPKGAFYAFPKVSDVLKRGIEYQGKKIENSVDLSDFILKEAEVALIPGNAFEAEGYLRLSYATSMEDIQEGLDRIEHILS